MACDRLLQPGEPGGVGSAPRQQTVALRDGRVVRRHLARVARLERPDQPVEEAAAAGGALQEQPVHLRREPDGRDSRRDLGGAARRGAVQAEGTTLGGVLRLGAGADVQPALRGHEPARNRPAAGGAVTREFGEPRAAQAAPGHQHRDRFQQVGLAAAVRPVITASRAAGRQARAA